MTFIEVTEALAVLKRILDGLAVMFKGAKGRSGFAVRHAIGDLQANGETYLREARLAAPLLLCFTTSREAGATLTEFDGLRAALLGEAPEAFIAVAVAHAGERFCLTQIARIIADTKYTSRSDADAQLGRIEATFDPAVMDAADEHDTASYRALLTLQGAVIRDLVDRSMLLPRRINFHFDATMPTLWLAQRIYYDGARADEILKENKVVHPAFPLRDLVCLSN